MKQMAIRSVTIGTLGRNCAVRSLAGLMGVIVLLLLSIYNQPYYPESWVDEGFVLQGAINLVRFGQYAMRSVEGFRILDQPLIANGPVLFFPLAQPLPSLALGSCRLAWSWWSTWF